MEVLKLNDIHKSYGNNKVLKGVNISLSQNEICAFIGKNGAGKTTTLRIIAGLIKADKGSCFICGKDISAKDDSWHNNIGYMKDVPVFYDYMNPIEYLTFCGGILKMTPSLIKERTTSLVERLNLQEIANKRIKDLSRGMKQKLGLCAAIIHKPQLLICDEPTSALDPIGRHQMLTLLCEMKKDTTILFSTHILSDANKIADTTAILYNGIIMSEEEKAKLLHSMQPTTLELELFDDSDKNRNDLISIINEINGVTIENNNKIIILESQNISDISPLIIEKLYQNNIKLKRFEIIDNDFETLVYSIYGQNTKAIE